MRVIDCSANTDPGGPAGGIPLADFKNIDYPITIRSEVVSTRSLTI